ncbi:GNAT family N-acetyltransferase [Vibrio nitrifigilis]|uniref:GNAT family N-acetyltransferase n=1 Tax=Vibrio nitrifigilis TaxID=2789781 RepID=A0ABS0GJ59_9VIBR|nr:GNAT family N-acetyltransferase [Vibrio nitrifigilis]MBF9002489.1 GNAT family N-acetyltransferase [Vibrio nitrifigilis]
MDIHRVTVSDIAILAKLNHQLIKDEGHRNPMSVDELEKRMSSWLSSGYFAALFSELDEIVGYTLWRQDEGFIYIRQFFITPDFRGKGNGKKAFYLSRDQFWSGQKLRLDVLINNHRGLEFWHTVGFGDYCITMENTSL